jgi:hypothetical protein
MKRLLKLSINILALALLTLRVRAQDTNVFIQDGSYAPDSALEAMRFMVSNALTQYGEMTSTNLTGSNEVDQADSSNNDSDTNIVTDAQGHIQRESRSEWLARQRARQASAVASAQARDAGQSGSANQRNDTPARPDYSAFGLVYERNIFDPNRVPHQISRTRRDRTARFESFSLVGTMTYDKGTFAFFDGTSSDYKKALKLSDAIAGYKITNITPDAVNLSNGTNQVELRVGTQMRSEEGGPWIASGQAQTYSDAPSTSSVASTSASHSSSSDSPPNGNESDVIKRMMQRREQE